MKALKRLIYQKIDRKYMSGCSRYNRLDVRRRCRSKQQARAVFSEANIPHAKGLVFLNPVIAYRFARQYGFPLVIKPNVSGFSRGSHFPIRDFRTLCKSIFLAKLWWPTTVVERYLEGRNYRVVVVKDDIMSVLRRYPPFVVGNGCDTIEQLIDTENRVRHEMGLYPCMFPLQKGRQTNRFLAKQGLTLSSILNKEEHIQLFYRISLASGGIVETISKRTIPQDNQRLFQKLLTLFDANILGIDVIFEKGIECSYLEQACIFLEVNSRPYLKMHEYPRYGEREDLSDYFDSLSQLEISDADIF